MRVSLSSLVSVVLPVCTAFTPSSVPSSRLSPSRIARRASQDALFSAWRREAEETPSGGGLETDKELSRREGLWQSAAAAALGSLLASPSFARAEEEEFDTIQKLSPTIDLFFKATELEEIQGDLDKLYGDQSLNARLSQIQVPIAGQLYPLKQLLGKKLTIVMNVKTEDPQAVQMSDLCFFVRRFGEPGDVSVILQPTDQGFTEPEESETLRQRIQASMNPTRLKNFYVLDKEDVNGPQASDLWRFLGESLQNPIAKTKSEFVSLNYEKFLLDGQGRPLRRYPRKWKPIKMLKEVKNLAKGEKLPPVDPDFKLAWLNANKERMADLYSFRLGINWYVPKGLEAMEGTRDAES